MFQLKKPMKVQIESMNVKRKVQMFKRRGKWYQFSITINSFFSGSSSIITPQCLNDSFLYSLYISLVPSFSKHNILTRCGNIRRRNIRSTSPSSKTQKLVELSRMYMCVVFCCVVWLNSLKENNTNCRIRRSPKHSGTWLQWYCQLHVLYYSDCSSTGTMTAIPCTARWTVRKTFSLGSRYWRVTLRTRPSLLVCISITRPSR